MESFSSCPLHTSYCCIAARSAQIIRTIRAWRLPGQLDEPLFTVRRSLEHLPWSEASRLLPRRSVSHWPIRLLPSLPRARHDPLPSLKPSFPGGWGQRPPGEASRLPEADGLLKEAISVLNLSDADGYLRATPAIQFSVNDPTDATDTASSTTSCRSEAGQD